MRKATDRPNIILINCDDLGYGDLGCYGSKANRTPALDKMASEGVRFTDFYMASPVCSPSRGAMMTGCYPKRIGFDVFDNGAWVLFPGHSTGLSTDEKTIASILKEQGYATKIVGKWHCGDQPEFLPTRHGFDSYFGLPYSNDMGRQVGRERQNPPLPLLRDEEVVQEQPDQTSLTERYVDECVRFIREQKDEPFFLYFAEMHVHLPLYAADCFMRRSLNGAYGACVEAVDWSVSALLDELKRQGIDENTLVIFTSDNGSRGDRGGSNRPLKGNKGTTWEGGMRVPCIMRWPGQIEAGRTSDEIVASIDFLPTLAGLAGTSEPTDRIVDGLDIREAMTGSGKSPRDVYYYYHRDNLEAVRSGPWKLHLWRGGERISLLYNLAGDIGETTDVADKHPDIVARLNELADTMRQDLGDAQAGIAGENVREPGRVSNPKPLTEYNEEHPYIIALYDLPDAG